LRSFWSINGSDHSDQIIPGFADIEILEKFKDIEVGFSIRPRMKNQADLRAWASPIKERIRALDVLHSRGFQPFYDSAHSSKSGGLIEQLPGTLPHPDR